MCDVRENWFDSLLPPGDTFQLPVAEVVKPVYSSVWRLRNGIFVNVYNKTIFLFVFVRLRRKQNEEHQHNRTQKPRCI